MCTLNMILNVFSVEMSSIVWPTVFTIFGALDPTFLKVSLLSTEFTSTANTRERNK